MPGYIITSSQSALTDEALSRPLLTSPAARLSSGLLPSSSNENPSSDKLSFHLAISRLELSKELAFVLGSAM